MENTDKIPTLETSTKKRKKWNDLEQSEKRNIITFSSIGFGLLSIIGLCLGFGIPQLMPSEPTIKEPYIDFKPGCYDVNGVQIENNKNTFVYDFLKSKNCYTISNISVAPGTDSLVLGDLYQGPEDTSTYMIKSIGYADGASSVFCNDVAAVKHIYCNTMYLTLGSFAMCDLPSLESVNFGDTTREYKMTVYSNCFENDSNLRTVILGNSLANIGDYAFKNCEKLESLDLPARFESFGAYAFEGCSSLTSINYAGSKSDWDKVKKHEKWASGSSINTVYCNGLPVSIN